MMKQDEESGMYEKSAGDDYPVVQVDTGSQGTGLVTIDYNKKQQSIEEAADQYCDTKYQRYRNGVKWEAAKEGYIAGAKSQAAKEYWYEIFKTETGKP